MKHLSVDFPPRISLSGPSPLIPLERLSAVLGLDIFIKREDLGAIGGGGNKLRKLECLVAEANARGCDTLITFGALQSNHARMVAAVAARQGLNCELVLSRKVPRQGLHYEQGGNLALDRIFGASLHVLSANEDAIAFAGMRAGKLAAEGHEAYIIPFGGSDALGAIAYSDCVRELLEQARNIGIEFDHLYHGSGSGGTQAGLVLGTELYASNVLVQGISVLHQEAPLTAIVEEILQKARDRLGVNAPDAVSPILVDSAFVGPGYGIPDARTLEAIEVMARTEGVILDPVYTGKAFAGLLDHVRRGRVKKGEKIVFLHTGGVPGLFAYADAFGPAV